MKKAILIISLFFAFSLINAAVKKKIIILEFQNLTPYNSYEYLASYFFDLSGSIFSPIFNVIPKSTYEDLIKQIKANSPNSLYSEKIAMQLGRILRAEAVIMGKYFYSEDTAIYLEIMVVKISAGNTVILKENYQCKSTDLTRGANYICIKLCENAIREIQR